MKCVVTGGAGFIGSNLVDKLIDEGHEVIIIDNLSTGKEENINPKAKFVKGDISHSPFICLDDQSMDKYKMLEGADVVFHTSALARVQPSIEEPVPFHNANVNSTHNLLAACKDAGVKKLITETGAGQGGSALAFACSHYGIDLDVYMVKVSFDQKPSAIRGSDFDDFCSELIKSFSFIDIIYSYIHSFISNFYHR